MASVLPVTPVTHNVPATPHEVHALIRSGTMHPRAYMSTGYMAYYNIDGEGRPLYSSAEELPALGTPFEIGGYRAGTVINIGSTCTITVNSSSLVCQQQDVLSTYSIRGLKQSLSHLADLYVRIDASSDPSQRADLPALLDFWTALRTVVVGMPPAWFPSSRFPENDTMVTMD